MYMNPNSYHFLKNSYILWKYISGWI